MYKRVLTVQDISCVGQCSCTVALPILSAAGFETAILPSAVLSTHTTGFYGYTCRDLTGDMPAIINHWKDIGIRFDALYTGYIENSAQIDSILRIMSELGTEDFVSIVDPAMADDGVLYPAFDQDYVEDIKRLVFNADIILPNITEACLLTGTEFRKRYDREYIEGLLRGLRAQGAGTIILTGVSLPGIEPGAIQEGDAAIPVSDGSNDIAAGLTGVAILEGDEISYYQHRKSPRSSNGTGDVFASAFAGAYLRGFPAYDAARIAAEYTLRCIDNTIDDPDHWYGVKFEPVLPYYIEELNRHLLCRRIND